MVASLGILLLLYAAAEAISLEQLEQVVREQPEYVSVKIFLSCPIGYVLTRLLLENNHTLSLNFVSNGTSLFTWCQWYFLYTEGRDKTVLEFVCHGLCCG